LLADQGYYDRFFVELERLGRGQRGMVFLCKHVLDHIDLGTYAVKAIAVGESHVWLAKMLREVSNLSSIGLITRQTVTSKHHLVQTCLVGE
jgi:hypothetical protein